MVHVICSNFIESNLILLIFKGDILINFNPPPPCPNCGDGSPPRVGTSLMDAPLELLNFHALDLSGMATIQTGGSGDKKISPLS